MKMKIAVSIILFFCFVSCSSIGPKISYVLYQGKICEKRKTFNYPEGVKTKMDEYIYNRDWLVKQTVFTVRWPNDEYHLISNRGFVILENGNYVFDIDSIAKPDNLIYEYYDQDFTPVIEVYKNGVREPFTLGYADGHQTMEYMRDPPGVYNWKDGIQYLERPFTQEEWKSHEQMNKYLNSDQYKSGLPDSLKY